MFSNDYIVFSDLNSDFVTFFIGFNSITLDNVNLYDNDFSYCDPKTNNHVRLMS